ncbi:hypothetical protein BJV78DRAFT_163667 [Lactifluus subvellereus]|nr:hypothetical protein BJV78DRAFT_163667 [Lactifluus subvellereus]
MFARRERMEHKIVITDLAYKLDDQIKILWEEKSPRVFHKFVGNLMRQISSQRLSGRDLYPETSATTYRGYRAILSKLSYHGMSIQPRVRWAVVFSRLKYIVIYIPRLPERPRFYCSPIMRFYLQPGDPEPTGRAPPPIWSLLVYMLLTETFNINNDTLRQRLGVPVPLEDSGGTSSLPLRHSKSLKTINEAGEGQRHSGNRAELGIAHGADGSLQAPGDMVVQCIDGLPMALSLVGTPQSSGGEEQHPFVHLDCYLGGGWSSVYASSRSHVIVKFATVPKKDRAELKRQLRNEKAVYDKLALLTRLVVPLCYGEYVWYGGRALVLSDEGQSLAALEMEFASLGLVERLVLFGQLYLIHRLGVDHRDFEPRNVLRKGWCRLTIIDFAFSDVNHSCHGWRECPELKYAWHEQLQLGRLSRLAFNRESGMLGKVRLLVGIVCGLSFVYFLFISLAVA